MRPGPAFRGRSVGAIRPEATRTNLTDKDETRAVEMSDRALGIGARIDDRYEIVNTLGAGGMGRVYRARRFRLGDEVAIKVMHATPDAPTRASSPDCRSRGLRV